MKDLRVAHIVHDGKKPEMISFVINNKEIFGHTESVATVTTSGQIEKEGLAVNRFLSNPLDGDTQIATKAAFSKLDLLIFFRDPLGKHPHEPDVQMLLSLYDVHNIPLATNPMSAEYILLGMKANQEST